MAGRKGMKHTSGLKCDHFIREFVESADKEMIIRIMESLNYNDPSETLSYIFFYYPELATKLTHWQLARLTGMWRETITRHIKFAMEEL